MSTTTTHQPLDTTLLVSTPENVAFDFRLAGPSHRAVAYFCDLLVMSLTTTVVAFCLVWFGLSGVGVFLAFLFVLSWGYGGLSEAFFNGQTLGKRAVGIRVVSDSGLSINGAQAILRNVLRSADLIPPFFPGVFAMLFGSRMQRLGDIAAGTMVVLDGARIRPRPHWARLRHTDLRDLIPPRYRPDVNVIDALAAYVGARADLSVPRRRELSHILANHFIRVWSLPPKTDPDELLCTVYEFATMNEEFWNDRNKPFVPDDLATASSRHRDDDVVFVSNFLSETRT